MRYSTLAWRKNKTSQSSSDDTSRQAGRLAHCSFAIKRGAMCHLALCLLCRPSPPLSSLACTLYTSGRVGPRAARREGAKRKRQQRKVAHRERPMRSHTHTHTPRDRERERERVRSGSRPTRTRSPGPQQRPSPWHSSWRCGPCRRSRSPTSWWGWTGTKPRRRTGTSAIACFPAASPRPPWPPGPAPGSR